MAYPTRAIVAATALVFAGAAIATPALAQTASQGSDGVTPPAATAPVPAPKLDGKKLKSFAVAYLQVDKIKREYQPQLAQAKSDSDKEKIRTEASQKMVEAVNHVEGMSVQEYSAILASAQADPDVAQKLTTEINKQAGSAH